MAEIRLDPINVLMPFGSRSMVPTTEFAAYLDEVWSRSTTTTTTTTNSTNRNSPVPTNVSRNTKGPVERRKDESKGERDGAGVAATLQRQTAPSESTAAPSRTPASETTRASTPNENSGQQTPPTGDAGDNARQAEASQPQAAARKEDIMSENTATDADADTALFGVPAEAEQQPAADGEASALLEVAAASEDVVSENSPSATESPVVGEAANEISSSEGESNAEGEKLAGLQETVESNNGGDGEPDSETQSGTAAESAESRSRHGRPATAKDAGEANEPQTTDLSQEQAVETPAQAADVATDDAAFSTAAIAATVETSQPTAPAANATSVEPVEGVATGTTRATSGESGARAASATPGTPEADQAGAVDRARFVQRVAQVFQATGDRGGTLRMRLSPPELGSLRVEITVKQGVMNARMETETDAARQLVLENLPALRERLAEQGIKVEQFQVDVSGREAGGQPNQFEDRSYSDRSEAEPRRHSTPRSTSAQDAESQEERRARRVGETSRLDVLV